VNTYIYILGLLPAANVCYALDGLKGLLACISRHYITIALTGFSCNGRLAEDFVGAGDMDSGFHPGRILG
jgi:hypothetical protein